jgi:hypothetical protein
MVHPAPKPAHRSFLRPAAPPATKPESDPNDPKLVEIKISLPSLPKLKLERAKKAPKTQARQAATHRRRPSRRTTIIAAASAATVLALVSAGVFMATRKDSPAKPEAGTAAAAEGKVAGAANTILERGTPDYDTVLPAGKTAESLGGWTRVSPPKSDPVYAYADKLAGIQIAVSQQPLPKELERNTDEAVEDLAKSYGATDRLEVGKTTAFMGTSVKGPQSIILTKDDTLILIKSQAPIPADTWKTYIGSLR